MVTLKAPARALIFLSILSFTLSVTPSGSGQQKAEGTDVRVGIILGNAPAATDEPKNTQTARCLKGFQLYKNGTVNKLLVTGGFTVDYISEARMAKIALVTFGVPAEDIVEDECASTTRENGLFAARLFDERGWQKTALLVSQSSHLARADGLFKDFGFQVKDAPSSEAVTSIEDFAQVPDMKADVNAEPSDLIVVYEPFNSLEPMEWPTPQLAHRLRVAAGLYHKKVAPALVLYNDRYTRGPVNIAQMMKIALVSLGVPAASIRVVRRGEYSRLAELAAAYRDKSATVLTTQAAGWSIAPSVAPKWKPLFVD